LLSFGLKRLNELRLDRVQLFPRDAHEENPVVLLLARSAVPVPEGAGVDVDALADVHHLVAEAEKVDAAVRRYVEFVEATDAAQPLGNVLRLIGWRWLLHLEADAGEREEFLCRATVRQAALDLRLKFEKSGAGDVLHHQAELRLTLPHSKSFLV